MPREGASTITSVAAAESLLTTTAPYFPPPLYPPIHPPSEELTCTTNISTKKENTIHHSASRNTIPRRSSEQQQHQSSSAAASRNRTARPQLWLAPQSSWFRQLLGVLLLVHPAIQPSKAFVVYRHRSCCLSTRSGAQLQQQRQLRRPHPHLGSLQLLSSSSVGWWDRPLLPSRTKMSALTSSTSSTEDPTAMVNQESIRSSSSIPNWQSLPKPSGNDNQFDSGSCLLTNHGNAGRPLWSDAAYQDSLQLYDKFTSCSDAYVRDVLQEALACVRHALRLYGPASTVCSFNGGKDAVVILHLVRAALAQYYHEQEQEATTSRYRPRVVYFEHEHEFPAILEFLHEAVQQYDLEMLAFDKGTKFQDGLQVLTDCNSVQVSDNTTIRLPMAFVLGTRLTDPNAVGQQPFAPSSHYMPPFMRVNPILHWTYGHVWHVLRLFQLPYCRLYDQGYTSLGTIHDTVPCPALAVPGYSVRSSSGNNSNNNSNNTLPKYWPAYMLSDWDQERAGRLAKEQVAANKHKKKLALKQQRQQQQQYQQFDNQSLTVPSEAETGSIGHLSTMSFARHIPIPTTRQNTNDTDDAASDDDFHIPSSVSYTTNDRQKSAALLIIGDEILKGFTADTNTQHAATALRDNNVLLKTVSVVSDDPAEIANEIRRLQKVADVIITSGGLGPTHDDVTLLSVSEALNCEMTLHPEMAQLLRKKMNGNNNSSISSSNANDDDTELTQAQQKMATLPASSKLRYLSDDPNDWPVLQVKNLFILPGVPEYFQTKITSLGAYLGCQLERRSFRKVVLKVDETSIVPILNQVVEHHPDVVIGSYPFVSHPEFKTVITVEARLVPLDNDLWLLDDRSEHSYSAAVTSNTPATMKNSTTRSISAVYDRSLLDEKCLLGTASAADTAVQMALDELIRRLPPGSVLRVESDDMTSLFS